MMLVTGAAGFIGSNLSEALLKKGYSVKGIDNFFTGKKENIRPFLKKMHFKKGTILKLKFLKKQFRGVDFVLHEAAIPSVPRSINDPLLTNRVNVEGTLNVLSAARDAGVKRVVFASSSSVYGDSPTLPKEESMVPSPKSPYAAQKLIGEQYMKMFYDLYGLETISLRYFNVFGPRQDPTSFYSGVIPKFINKIQSGENPVIFGDGSQSRDFSYISNVIDANILACKAKKTRGEIVNIACGQRITVNELVLKINRFLKTDVSAVYEKEQAGDVKHSLADISRAEKILKYVPKTYFDEGLKKTIEWHKK